MRLTFGATVLATVTWNGAVDAAPVWSTDRADLVTVAIANPDGMTANVTSHQLTGTVQIFADVTAGGLPLRAQAAVDVGPGFATAGTITFGTPAAPPGGGGGGTGPTGPTGPV